ncbi:MAG TPA: methylated-DNA--[protein]-cysteine S-methyltransferase, partial [Acidimicrobiales bacterium]|nr:methylated-DNA--[protein]-cysteine S-methyltransferase [Acidimicrobiales bacterium]
MTRETTTVRITSPIGTLTIEGDDHAITHIELPTPGSRRAGGPARPSSDRTATTGSPKAPGPGESSGALGAAVAQLEQYFAGERTEFDLPLELSGTEFQREVWIALGDIPFGKTISYAELAEMVGRPRAFRAVGQANGSNPIPIVLPCHRVV